jgi:ABC-type molybdate transport system permease subunit
VAIYYSVELGKDSRAWMLAGLSATLAFLAIWAAQRLLRRPKR